MPKEELTKTTLWLSKRDRERLTQFYGQRGSTSKVVRALLHRHLDRLENRTNEFLGEKLTEIEINV